MKRMFCIVLTLCIITGIFAGCSKKPVEQSTSVSAESIEQKPQKEYVDETQFTALYTSPKDFKGKYVKLTGRIMRQPELDDKGIYFQMWADPENNMFNTVVAYANKTQTLKAGDFVSVDGQIADEFKGENAFGADVSAVTVIADTVNVGSRMADFEEIIRTATLAMSTDQNGCIITIDKIEYTKSETRVFLTAVNNSQSKFRPYTYNAKLVQNGAQFEKTMLFDESVKDLPNEIIQGATASGEIIFPAVDSSQVLQFYIEASSDDYQLKFEPYVFDIAAE